MSQATKTESSTSVWVRDEKTGESIAGVTIDESGIRGTSGRLLGQKGNGETVAIEDPIRFFQQIYDVAFEIGRKYQREKGGC